MAERSRMTVPADQRGICSCCNRSQPPLKVLTPSSHAQAAHHDEPHALPDHVLPPQLQRPAQRGRDQRHSLELCSSDRSRA